MSSNGPSFVTIFLRCMFSKCPACGQGWLFCRITSLRGLRDLFLPLKHCEVCRFCFERQPGYYFGVITPVLPILALTTGTVCAGVAHFGFHQGIETVLTWGAVGIGFGFLLFFRTSIAIYIALDHAIDPPKQVDLPLGDE